MIAQDLFQEAREAFTIADAWRMLGYEGEPKRSCRSPFRDERNPSFSVFDDGTGWKDHATGEGGDVIEFFRVGLGTDYKGVREFLMERMGGQSSAPLARPARCSQRPAKPPEPPKAIEWPGELVQGSVGTWDGFSKRRRLSFRGVSVAVKSGCLRFLRVNGVRCFAMTDATGRAAEIRRIDGGLFGERKAYPLRGVDKTWPVGLAMSAAMPKSAGILLTEGATDLLTAIDLYSRYRREGGMHSWIPAAMLGASCKTLAPEAAAIIRGRRVRLVPDADDAGAKMADHWRGVFLAMGCTVDVVKLPHGRDLSDMRASIQPEELFNVVTRD